MRFQGIRLLVEDFDAMFTFYSQVLELKVTWGKLGDVYASFEIGGETGISIFDAKLMDESVGESITGARRNGDLGVLIFAVDDLTPVYDMLQPKEVNIVNKPHDQPGWGCCCLHLRDPEGNLIEFNAPLDKDKWSEGLKEDAKNY